MKKYLELFLILSLMIILVGCTDNTGETSSNSETNITTQINTTDQTTTSFSSESSSTTTFTTTFISTEEDGILIVLNPGIDTIEVFDDFIDAGAIASYDTNDLVVTVIENTVNTDQVGVYYIQYLATHGDKTAQIFRAVFVIDTTKPEVSLNPGIDTVYVGETWVDMGVTVTDNYDVDCDISVTGSVDTSIEGTYQITYVVSDSSGNKTEVIRYVNVISES